MPILANAKHEAVAQAYIADPEKIGWRAYRKVYPGSSQHAAETCFGRLLKNVEFSARIAELAEAAAQDAVISANEVLQELTKVGRVNMLDYMRIGPQGDPVLDFSRLTRDQAAGLIEVTVEDFLDGRGENAREVRRVRFKLASKIAALELLGKHHKLYVDRQQHDWGEGIAERLAAALARVDGDREPAQEQRDPYDQTRATPHEATSSRRPTDRRRRSSRLSSSDSRGLGYEPKSPRKLGSRSSEIRK
jgi:phage terminase small subunit